LIPPCITVAHRRDTSIPQALLQPFPAQLMTAYPISTKINSVKNDTPAVIEPLRLGVQTRTSLLYYREGP
jgi:hypothetical protein